MLMAVSFGKESYALYAHCGGLVFIWCFSELNLDTRFLRMSRGHANLCGRVLRLRVRGEAQNEVGGIDG